MKLTSGITFDINEVAAKVIASVDKYNRRLIRTKILETDYQTTTAQLIKSFNDRLLFKGESVSLSGGNREDIIGILLGADEHGHLLIETEDGIKSAVYGEYHLNKRT